MAGIDILAKYGIKEVADVVFYELSEAGKPTKPVLYLDTLKVSTIEQTAESSDARGGKGNAALISWDYGKEINVTLEDALFSAKSMAIMFGNGKVNPYDTKFNASVAVDSKDNKFVMRTMQFIWDGTAKTTWTDPKGNVISMINPKYYDAYGRQMSSDGILTALEGEDLGENNKITDGERYFASFDVAVKGAVIVVSADSFPGTYYVTGDTYARSEASGNDEFFQFIIPKAKVQSENTITLEAEGDPSVFNMSLKVLRATDGAMMKLVKYELAGASVAGEGDNASIYHNHILIPENGEG